MFRLTSVGLGTGARRLIVIYPSTLKISSFLQALLFALDRARSAVQEIARIVRVLELT